MTAKQGTRCDRLGEVLRERRDEILVEWEAASRELAINRDLDRPALLDDLPEVLAGIADSAAAIATGDVADLPLRAAGVHATGRLSRGFDLEEVVSELALLRDCIVARMLGHGTPESEHAHELRVLNQAIDTTVTATIARYTEARDRTLREFDRVVTVAVEKHDLDEVLQSLLRVLLDRATPDIDTAAILLRDGDVLHVRATIGIAIDRGFAIPIGEGFAGTIAAAREPRSLLSAASDPLVINPELRAAGVRALYGVPLIDSGDVIGVAHIGSLSASKLAPQDRELLELVAARATWAIFQHMLRERSDALLRDAERTALQLQEREAQFRTLADNIPQLAWMADRAGSVFWYNQRWFDFTGATLDELGGTGWQKVQHPDHLKDVIDKVQHALEVGEAWEDTFPMRGKNGWFRWFLTRAVPIRDADGNVVRWFGTNTDVTAQRCLSEATKLLHATLDYRDTLERLAQVAVPDLADWCVVDILEDTGPCRLAVAHMNPAKVELARKWASEHPPDWNASRGVPRVLRTGEPEVFHTFTDDLLVAIASDADSLAGLRRLAPSSMISVPLASRHRTLGALTLISAESGRRYQSSDVEVATELGRRAGTAIDNARLYREARDAIRLREKILAIVSHDLRNPLANIDLGASTLLEDSHLSPAIRKPLEIIRRSSIRMERMIGDLLDLARIQSGSLKLEREPCDAAAVMADSLDLNVLLARDKGITISRELDVHGTVVSCDPLRIEQVFANLLGNAIKFCKAGDTIAVRATRDGDRVRYIVADSGPGIRPDELAHIFEPYASGRDHVKEGLGLGLSIAKGIVEAHGGEISVESEPGSGATFIVTLPAAPTGS